MAELLLVHPKPVIIATLFQKLNTYPGHHTIDFLQRKKEKQKQLVIF